MFRFCLIPYEARSVLRVGLLESWIPSAEFVGVGLAEFSLKRAQTACLSLFEGSVMFQPIAFSAAFGSTSIYALVSSVNTTPP